MKYTTILGVVSVGLFVVGSTANAQFHNKDKDSGQAVMNPQARANLFKQQSGAQVGRGIASSDGNRVTLQRGAHYLPAWANDPNLHGAIRLGEMGERNSYVLGQVVHHTDGSYTETTREEKMTREISDIQQTTYSPRGVKLETRTIKHNERGQPYKVSISDAHGKAKYQGTFVYDPLSRRLKEEQLYDMSGRLLRRTIQEYDAQGNKLPVKVFNEGKIPLDLQLVVTQDAENLRQARETDKKGLFAKMQKKQQEEEAAAAGVSTGAVPAAKEKKGFLGGLFKGKKNK